MTRVTATVRNENGIHCRPSAVIIKEAATLISKLRVVSSSGETNLRSIIDLLALGLGPGETLDITTEGPDEVLAAARLHELFERNFDFPARPPGQSAEQILREFKP
jgi:phosphotransferase system HPr (HPr) family protein